MLPNIFLEYGDNSIECIEEIELEHPSDELDRNDRAAPTILEESKEGNEAGARIPQGMFAHVEMNMSHKDANLQQSLVASFATLPLSLAACISYDNKELHDNVVYSPMTKLTHQHVKPILNGIRDASKHVHCLVSKKDELELLSSFNTLGYIEFDILCNLNCLKEKLQFDSNLLSFYHCLLHAIGESDRKGEYLVHKVYIGSHMNASMGLQGHDDIMGCTNANDDLYIDPLILFLCNRFSHKKRCNIGCRPAAFSLLRMPIAKQVPSLAI